MPQVRDEQDLPHEARRELWQQFASTLAATAGAFGSDVSEHFIDIYVSFVHPLAAKLKCASMLHLAPCATFRHASVAADASTSIRGRNVRNEKMSNQRAWHTS
ncbi:hypothetical protein J2W28_006944 [Variovorax boronicumulans]|uniref:hypothetical protein n=1 Tax=Variovorax boronicumulans TaxID=436515 RepID=UPI0027871588|nr:hypothetical protein [Variovorax boronicumulans]MDP9996477.1 hypothetical protein [Variovorax boronicumulans]MDQ0007765.1 hypothetical protein [Variovorax boronicumulans]